MSFSLTAFILLKKGFGYVWLKTKTEDADEKKAYSQGMSYVDEEILVTRLAELDDILAHYDRRLEMMPDDCSKIRREAVIHGKRIHQEEQTRLLQIQADNEPDLEQSIDYISKSMQRFIEEPFESDSEYVRYHRTVVDLMQRALEYDTAALLELLQRAKTHAANADKQAALGKPPIFYSSHAVIFEERIAHYSRLLAHAQTLKNTITLPHVVVDEAETTTPSLSTTKQAL